MEKSEKYQYFGKKWTYLKIWLGRPATVQGSSPETLLFYSEAFLILCKKRNKCIKSITENSKSVAVS